MTPQQAREWIEQSPPTRKLLDDLGIPANPQPGSLDEMEAVIIAEGVKAAIEEASQKKQRDDWLKYINRGCVG